MIHHADVLDALRAMPDNSFHGCLTDPPYGLSQGKKGGTGQASENLKSPAGRSRATTGFMGHTWDAFVPPAEVWREVLRVLRPGAHLLAFGGTRTFHRLMCAIEDAGFEVRDCMMWLYGSGFPKSLDVSKALDNAGGDSPAATAAWLSHTRAACGLSREDVALAVGCTTSSVRDWEDGRARTRGGPVEYIVPAPGYREKLRALFASYPEDARVIVGDTTVRANDATVIGLGHGGTLRKGGQTEAARQWEGHGTALKPAWEPIILARKPLEGTVAQNVQRWGCGALAIDACRVGHDEPAKTTARTAPRYSGRTMANGVRGGEQSSVAGPDPLGRWPANVILDEEAGAALDAQSGTLKSGSRAAGVRKGLGFHGANGDGGPGIAGSSGGASRFFKSCDYAEEDTRFFYCAKASKAERGEGNVHPTVKPLALATYLARLILPPVEGSRLLVPFCGSGSEMLGGLRAGWSHVEGIDAWNVAVDIARARLA